MSSASETAYRTIREWILSGALPPRAPLKEENLARLCGVSRTPVREALRRLEAEMLVFRSDTQRSFVPDWSADTVEEVFTLRALLEGQAAVRAATRITPADIAELQRFNDAIHRSIHDQPRFDIDSFVANNRHFHDGILRAAQSDRLTRMYALLVEQAMIHRTASRYDVAALARSHGDHEEIIHAFIARDPEWARSLMESHIRRAMNVTLERYVADEVANAA